MSLGSILLLILILMVVGVIPAWPHSREWGYGPSGGLGLMLLILIIVTLWGRLRPRSVTVGMWVLCMHCAPTVSPCLP